ncbi:breast cancer type 1 susceptibility protein homolog [Nasonia vitripennis]|uniref:RING-type E3 ubiquitin transferase BRCA1 n=1 Tax=Nasonia vitripennis TaxID=7425 RepID=A0A7M7LIR9_NASVI|nr:breast cancer type 1 susceptibility protein homolog [Nasonia vitripennis]
MDEYTASCTQVQTIINAAQCIRECLTCSICLDYFKKPVTIKCGHKFCQGCILEVANNDNASCPLCNTKFQRRSIHKENNKQFESCVERFRVLSKAIQDDSGIDVLESCHTAKNSKESVPPIPKPSPSRVVEASTSSRGSAHTKIRASGKGRAVLQKKSFTPKTRTTRRTSNTLYKYLSAKTIGTPDDEKVESQDKVESWLQFIEPADADNEVIDEINRDIIEDTDNEAISNPEDSPLTEYKHANQPSTNKSCFTETKQSCEKPLPHTYPSTSKGITKYKETEMRIQEAEIMARKKKLNQALTDRAILKTPSSVPAVSHSDAHDWRRVKRVGKEMQVKTFKSLNVSKEKSFSSIVLDDTVPCNLKTPERSRNVFDLSNPEIIPKAKGFSSPSQINTNHRLQENELPGEESLNLESKSNPIDSLNSPPKRKLSLKMKSLDSTSSKSTQSHASTPDKINLNKTESPTKITTDRPKSRLSLRLQISKPAEHKLGLKKSSNENQNPTRSNEHKLSLNKSPNKNQTPIISSEQKLSQKKSPNKNQDTTKINEHKLSFKKPPNKNQNPISTLSTDKSKSARLPNSKIVLFRKLGKICKKSKYIPFKKLGRLCPRVTVGKVGVKVISNQNVNVDISCIKVKRKVKETSNEVKMVLPEEDSQLKFFTVEASPCAQPVSRKTFDGKSPVHESAANETHQTIMTMEIDESLPSVTLITSQRKQTKDNKSVGRDDAHSETTNSEPPTSNCKKPEEGIRSNVNERKFDDVSSKTCEKVDEDILTTNIDGKSSKKCKNFESSNHENLQKNLKSVEILHNAISISSNESESRDTRKQADCENIDLNRKNKHSEVESETSESSLMYVPKQKEKFDENKSVCSSRSSSPLRTSPLKKKRTHSESSNDDDDDLVTSIIGKWTNAKPVVKKPKVIENNQKSFKKSKNKSNQLENSDSDDNEQTLVKDESKQPEFVMPQRDPPIDDIISKVKSFKEQKEDNYSVNKLTGLPSSLQSADLFESNDSRLRVEANKQSNEITSDNSSVSTWNPNKESDKENVDQSFEAEEPRSETTVVDLLQFDGKKSNGSICSNSSNKENNACNKVNADNSKIKDQVNKVKSSPNEKSIADKSHDSPLDLYHVPDSLMNITQEQLALKMIEKDLMGADISTVNNENRDSCESNKFATPRRKVVNSRAGNNDDDFDSESIDATPVAKKRRIFRQCQSKSSADAGINSCEIFSPEKSLQLIAAVTPMRNRTSYPLCHSTPMMINTPSPEKQSRPQRKPMALICSGLTPANIKIVQNFAKKFNATFLVTFTEDVTHVIVATDPETKLGQKTLKYIQGIAFKKHVISFQWILDCLDENAILDEDDEKYDVLDPEICECGARRSRNRVQDLFENFAFYCLEPFSSISLADLKSLLVYNGASVTSTVKELSLRKDKYRVIILESEELCPKKLAALKKVECVMVSFEWVVDSISQYQIVSLFTYLYETSPEEAIAIGLPPSYLTEEVVEEEEEDEEEE